MRSATVRGAIAALALVCSVSGASAQQVFGTFTWQMQPYCNKVTLTLTSLTGNFTLEGTDDQCGATNKASAVGVAIFNAVGNVTLNFTLVTAPSAKPVHVSAIVSPSNGSGTWTDSVGNSGTFAFFGDVPGLPARPLPASGLPAAIITNVEIAPGAVTGASVADGSLSSVDLIDAPRVQVVSGDQQVTLTGANVVVRTLSLVVPRPGRVLVSASGYFPFTNVAASLEVGRCSITTGTGLDFSHLIIASDGGSTSFEFYAPFAAVRGFEVSAGTFTVNLVCTRGVNPPDTAVSDTSLTALFVAQ